MFDGFKLNSHLEALVLKYFKLCRKLAEERRVSMIPSETDREEGKGGDERRLSIFRSPRVALNGEGEQEGPPKHEQDKEMTGYQQIFTRMKVTIYIFSIDLLKFEFDNNFQLIIYFNLDLFKIVI